MYFKFFKLQSRGKRSVSRRRRFNQRFLKGVAQKKRGLPKEAPQAVQFFSTSSAARIWGSSMGSMDPA